MLAESKYAECTNLLNNFQQIQPIELSLLHKLENPLKFPNLPLYAFNCGWHTALFREVLMIIKLGITMLGSQKGMQVYIILFKQSTADLMKILTESSVLSTLTYCTLFWDPCCYLTYLQLS